MLMGFLFRQNESQPRFGFKSLFIVYLFMCICIFIVNLKSPVKIAIYAL